MKRFLVMLILMVVCVSMASAEISADGLEKMNRYFFRTGIIVKNNNIDYAVCVDYMGNKWKVPHGRDWRIGEVCTLWLYKNKRETGVYWAIHGGYSTIKEWGEDVRTFEEKHFELITEEEYYPVHYYAVTMVINKNGIGIDCDGKKWHLPDTCSFAKDDILTCMVWNNGTSKLSDDLIVAVTYSGHVENFFKKF